MWTFTDCVLCGGRRRPAGLRVDERRAGAECPDPIEPGYGERGIRRHPAALVQRTLSGAATRQDRVRSVTDRADNSRGPDLAAVVEPHVSGLEARQPPAENNGDSGSDELLGRVPPEPLAELRQHVPSAVNEHDAR